jgi:hypothetical protein
MANTGPAAVRVSNSPVTTAAPATARVIDELNADRFDLPRVAVVDRREMLGAIGLDAPLDRMHVT